MEIKRLERVGLEKETVMRDGSASLSLFKNESRWKSNGVRRIYEL